MIAAMTDNVLIPLSGFSLPGDFPWRVGFVASVDEQLRRLRASGYFLPPRFFGYYFCSDLPVAVGGAWTVTLEAIPPATLLPAALEKYTLGQYSIASASRAAKPAYMLVHDTHGGACWLWSFAEGLKFIEAVEPVTVLPGGLDPAENPNLLGP